MPGSPLDRTLGGANVLTVDGGTHAHMRDPMETTLRPKAVEERAPEIVRRVADAGHETATHGHSHSLI